MAADPHRWLQLPGAPSIDGFRVRAYEGPADIPAIVEVYRAANDANGVAQLWTADLVRVEVETWSHLDPLEDLLLAYVGDRPVAVSEIGWADTSDGDRHYRSLGHVHPEWRRNGIGGAMLTRNERRLSQLAAAQSVSGAKVLMTWNEDPDAGAAVLLRSRGYERVRTYHHMTRPDLGDIQVPPMPEGLQVHSVTPAQLSHVWDAMMEAFRDHFGSHDESAEAFRRWSLDPDLDLDLLVIAFDGDEIAGGVQGQIDAAENEARGYLRGWTDPVFTRRPWRRRGLASALIGRTLELLRGRGMTSAQLDVDSQNPNQALGLYQRHGFIVDRSSSEWHRPLTM